MPISFVAEGQYIFAGTANANVFARIPTGTQAGDLMVCSFGNVASQTVASTMNNSWTKIREDISGTNCYFLMAAKIATATDATNAGTDTQIATLNSTTGQTNKTCQSMSYRGTQSTVATAVVDSNFTHESAPADQTINTNTATAAGSTQWYVCFFNMAAANANGDQSTGTFSGTSLTFRGHAQSYNTGATNSANGGADSNGTTTAGAKSFNGTWSGTATRLNAGIMILNADDISASAGSVAPAATTNQPIGGVGAKAQVIG